METSLTSGPEEAGVDEILLEVNAASFRYSTRGPWLFKGLSLTVSAGEILSVLGPNARGKTTLLKCFAGLLKPAEGQIRSHADIGYVPQDHGPGAAFLVKDMVLMGRTRMLRPFQVPREEDREAAAAAMRCIGVADWAELEYGRLSGGQRQLVLIARAVASGSRILILDEPASALDLRNQAKILEVLGQLAEDGFAIVMTTHHPDHALHVSRNALLFVGSHDTRWGTVENMLSASALSEVYGLPICLPRVLTDSGSRHVAVPDFGQGCRVNRIAPSKIATLKENS